MRVPNVRPVCPTLTFTGFARLGYAIRLRTRTAPSGIPAMKGEHHYDVNVTWTGNTGKGTASYTAVSYTHLRAHET